MLKAILVIEEVATSIVWWVNEYALHLIGV